MRPPTGSRCWPRPAARCRPRRPSPSAILTARSFSRTTQPVTRPQPSLPSKGLRPTSAGGHVAVDSAIRAQFGDGFRGFGYLRRRRNELEYPSASTAASDVDEANEAVAESRGIVQAAEQLLPNLGFFA